MQAEWWRAGEHDDFSLDGKLARVGCRPLKRKFLACKISAEEMDLEKYA